MLPFARIIQYANIIIVYLTKVLLHADSGAIDLAKPTRVIGTVGTVPILSTPAIVSKCYDHRTGYFTLSAVERSDTNIGTGNDFTMEWYAYCTNNTANNWYVSSGTGTTSGLKIFSSNLYLQGRLKGGSVASSIIPLNTWTHFCIMQRSGNVYLYIGGTLRITLTTDIWGDANTPLRIGGYETNSLAYYDQFRITNRAVYSGASTITVPPVPLQMIP